MKQEDHVRMLQPTSWASALCRETLVGKPQNSLVRVNILTVIKSIWVVNDTKYRLITNSSLISEWRAAHALNSDQIIAWAFSNCFDTFKDQFSQQHNYFESSFLVRFSLINVTSLSCYFYEHKKTKTITTLQLMSK